MPRRYQHFTETLRYAHHRHISITPPCRHIQPLQHHKIAIVRFLLVLGRCFDFIELRSTLEKGFRFSSRSEAFRTDFGNLKV